MPRKTREKFEYSIYHITVKGNNDEEIFFSDEDRMRYLQTLRRYKERYKVEIYGYCLMNNHVHLLVYDNGQDISKFMQGLSLSYTMYFNRIHERTGHLFKDRFFSNRVVDDNYFLHVSRYIHNNPVKANVVETAEDYEWSSIHAYIGKSNLYDIVDCNRVLGYFCRKKTQSIKLYVEYMRSVSPDVELPEDKQVENVVWNTKTRRSSVQGIEVIEQVAQSFKMDKKELQCISAQMNGWIRNVCIYLVAVLCKIKYKEIGQFFGLGEVAICVAIKKAINHLISDKKLWNQVNELIGAFS